MVRGPRNSWLLSWFVWLWTTRRCWNAWRGIEAYRPERGFLQRHPWHHVRWLSSPSSPQRRPCASGNQSLQTRQGLSWLQSGCPSFKRHCWQWRWLLFLLRKSEHPGNLGWDLAEDDRSRDRSAILSTQVRLTRRKQTASHTTYLPKTSTWAQLTNFTESHNYLLSSCSINAWEGHWYSAWIGLTSVHERGENWSVWLGYVVLCAGAAAHGPWRGLNFIVWNFAWDRLASRLYAATATTFLMKIYN